MLNLPQFLFVNGPPGSGKSTLTKLIEANCQGCWPEAFAEPIRDMIRVVFFPNEGPIDYSVDLKDGAVKKQNLLTLCGLNLPSTSVGPSVRQAMIEFSQNYMKTQFGQDIFGRLLWKRCQDQMHWYNHFLIDDSGFPPEAQYIIDQVGAANCALIRLHRDGVTFAGDSRGYIDLPIPTHNISNNGAAMEMLSDLQLAFGNI